MQHRARLLAPAVCLPFLACFAPPVEGPFQKLSLSAALAKAGEAKKVVMVDFFTTWCGPCKKLDQETWPDARVSAWLGEHAVAIKLDAEREREAAKQHRIGAYPTLLFLKSDGTELGRLVGFRPPETFLQQAGDLLAGKTPLDALKQKVAQGGEDDPMLRQDLGEELADAGRHEEALAQYLWCWDHGLEHSLSYGGVRGSFLVSRIRDLAREYPPALEAMRQRRDACEAALLNGKVTLELARDLPTLNGLCDDGQSTLRVYDAVRVRENLDQWERMAIRMWLFRAVLDDLLAAERYQEVLDGGGDYNAAVDQQIAMHGFQKAAVKDRPEAQDMEGMLKRRVVEDCSRYYQALLGTARAEDARALAQRLIDFDPRAGTYQVLIQRADAAKAPDEAAALRKRGQDAPRD